MLTVLSAALDLLAPQESPVPTLLAIDGHSASGKSSLARDLHEAYPASAILHIDDFYRPLPEPIRAALDAASGYQMYYDWQRLEAQVLRPLSQGQQAHYQRYDSASNRLAEWITVPPAGLLIVEGWYAARPRVARLLSRDRRDRHKRGDTTAPAAPAYQCIPGMARSQGSSRAVLYTPRCPAALCRFLVRGE